MMTSVGVLPPDSSSSTAARSWPGMLGWQTPTNCFMNPEGAEARDMQSVSCSAFWSYRAQNRPCPQRLLAYHAYAQHHEGKPAQSLQHMQVELIASTNCTALALHAVLRLLLLFTFKKRLNLQSPLDKFSCPIISLTISEVLASCLPSQKRAKSHQILLLIFDLGKSLIHQTQHRLGRSRVGRILSCSFRQRCLHSQKYLHVEFVDSCLTLLQQEQCIPQNYR